MSGPDVLALGAWLKNAACCVADGVPAFSAVHGDLGDPQACAALDASVAALLQNRAGPINAVAHDLHPDFYSTRLALRLADELGVPAIGVQHHHAHIAAVMAEHGLTRPVIGLALDGVGLGTDGAAWGGELLQVGPAGWTRLGHLLPLALPGGDVAAREPWRMAAAALHAMGRADEIVPRFGVAVGHARAAGVRQMLARNLRCPPTSSTGRWFDAAAAALGLHPVQDHEAQAAMALEQLAREALDDAPPDVVERWATEANATMRGPIAAPLSFSSATVLGWTARSAPSSTATATEAEAEADVLSQASHLAALQVRAASAKPQQLDLRPLLAHLFNASPADRARAAATFHLGLAQALAQWAAAAAERYDIDTVCLGGGCFLNRILTERLTQLLETRHLRVLRPLAHSCGDAGLALGQAWVAQQQLLLGRGAGVVVPVEAALPRAAVASVRAEPSH